MTFRQEDFATSDSLANDVMNQAQDLVLLWDRAEDWAVPRIPPSQLRVLSALSRYESLNLTQLAHAVGAIPSSASRLCDRLEAAGLIVRKTSAGSRREVTVRLSEEGQRRLDAFADTRRSDFAEVLSRMSPHSQAALLDGLRAFSHAADGADQQTG